MEEKRERCVESLGQLLQTASRNPIGPVFVPLYLLEGHAERIGKLSLTDAQHLASAPYPSTDILIDPVQGSFLYTI